MTKEPPDTTDIQGMKNGLYEQLYAKKLNNLEEVEKFSKYTITKTESVRNTKSEQISYQSKEIDSVVKNLPKEQRPATDAFNGKFYQTFKT